MGRSLITRYHAELDFSRLDDTDRHQLVAGIALVAPQSPLVINNVGMQTCLAALIKQDAALVTANATVNDDRQKLRTDVAAEATTRGELDGGIRTFATFAENGAASAADLHTVGLVARTPTPTKKLPPAAPAGIDTILPKTGHGQAKVSAQETGTTRQQFVAESSPDPVGPATWTPLGVGHGKTRVVTGASGTKVWVRFAMVRGQLQSDWNTPTLITIP
jgi:hypothetical protein